MSQFWLNSFLIATTVAYSMAHPNAVSSSISNCDQDIILTGGWNYIHHHVHKPGHDDHHHDHHYSDDDLRNITLTILDLLQNQDPCPSCCNAEPITADGLPRDCAEIQAGGVNTSGVYAIYPDGAGDPFFVSCDMETDGGGWTVFQRREDGSVDFYLDWLDYKYGFGTVAGEHWLGNDNIRRLSTQKLYELRVDLEDFAGNTSYASYAIFSLADEANNYRLTVGSYSGNAGDSLTHHSGSPFSTRDRDNDASSSASCAVNHRGAWWYVGCHYSNLNGQYLGGMTGNFGNGVVWYHWLGYYYSLKKTEMKIRPV